MSVIPFPRPERREDRIRGIEQCLSSLAVEAEDMGLDLLSHLIAVAREAAHECLDEADLTTAFGR